MKVNVSEQQFVDTYYKYTPNKFIKFIYKYFSKDTEGKDLKVGNTITWILVIFFILGFVGTIFNLSHKFIGIATYLYSGILAVLVISLFTGVFMNNARIRKIRKELGLSKAEYNELAEYYL